MRALGLAIALAATALLGGSAIFAPAADAYTLHVVGPGESLTSIAAADGLSVEQLATANGLSPTAELLAGSLLSIPPQDVAPAEQTGAAVEDAAVEDDDSSTTGSYLVQPGDTLSGIAAQVHTTVSQLATVNGLDPNGLLLAGTTLTLPGEASESSSDAASSQPVGAAAEGSSEAPPYATPEVIDAEEIGQIADDDGVPPSLAEAVAYQESGFNNDFVSDAGARGVMQITPGTWSWIDEALAGAPLETSSAAGNVNAGALLLHSLLEASGEDEEVAIAGYYQGLPSVLENGIYPSTRQYVSDVLALQQRFEGA